MGKVFFDLGIESIIGVFMNLICIARFINMLPEVKSMSSN